MLRRCEIRLPQAYIPLQLVKEYEAGVHDHDNREHEMSPITVILRWSDIAPSQGIKTSHILILCLVPRENSRAEVLTSAVNFVDRN